MQRFARLPVTYVVVLTAVAIRILLIPITHGQDFVVWDLASKATLEGQNIYANHPVGYPGGPYTYPPLFLYLELPFQWLATNAGLSFVVLGKIPIVLADLVAGGLIACDSFDRQHGDRRIALGCGLYLLNPLVLYNGAFYGRFDSVCVAMLALAVRQQHHHGIGSWRFLFTFSAAIATKLYPAFLLPWLWLRHPGARARLLTAVVVVVGGLSSPYLLASPIAFLRDVFFYNLAKAPSNLSWQTVLSPGVPPFAVWAIGILLLVVFVVMTFRLTALDLPSAALVSILVFLLLSKLVIEQYLIWTFPFLIMRVVSLRAWPDMTFLIFLSGVGMLATSHAGLAGPSADVINVLLAGAILMYLRFVIFQQASPETWQPARQPTSQSPVRDQKLPGP